jgi:hypothetical protein
MAVLPVARRKTSLQNSIGTIRRRCAAPITCSSASNSSRRAGKVEENLRWQGVETVTINWRSGQRPPRIQGQVLFWAAIAGVVVGAISAHAQNDIHNGPVAVRPMITAPDLMGKTPRIRKIACRSRRRPQYVQHPAPSCFPHHAPRPQRRGAAELVGGNCGLNSSRALPTFVRPKPSPGEFYYIIGGCVPDSVPRHFVRKAPSRNSDPDAPLSRPAAN